MRLAAVDSAGTIVASTDAVVASRARLVQATDRERRRIARDLHDGLQTRLILLAMRADRVRTDVSLSAQARAEVVGLHAELWRSISELREFVHGVMPSVLTERGLLAAVQELAAQLPLPLEVSVSHDDSIGGGAGRLPAGVESAGYFVVCEALANAVKHSKASRLFVDLNVEHGWLRIEVRDDGVGGASAGGSGIQGIVDRVESVTGRLTLHSPVGRGTCITAELPCAS
jgi:signal transduction histidine kinase